jgi:polyribonucleotide nucleotidyltransferase
MNAMQPVIDLIIDFAEDAAKEPFDFTPPDYSALYAGKRPGEAQMRAAFAIRDKQERTTAIAPRRRHQGGAVEEDLADANLGSAIKKLESSILRGDVVNEWPGSTGATPRPCARSLRNRHPAAHPRVGAVHPWRNPGAGRDHAGHGRG